MSRLLLSRRPGEIVIPPAGWAPNQPAGLTTILDTQFDPEDWGSTDEELGPGGFQFIGDVENETITAGSTFGNTHSAKCYQPGGTLGGGFGTSGLYREAMPTNAARLYTCAEVRLAAVNPALTYSVHEPGGEKFWYPNPDAGPGGGTAIELTPPPGQDHDSPFAAFKMLTQDGSDPPFLFQPANGVYLTKEQWDLLEIELQYNTPGSSNGVLHIRINNVTAWHLTDVSFSISGSQRRWITAPWDDTRGGGNSTNPTPVGGQYREFSRWRVAISNSLS